MPQKLQFSTLCESHVIRDEMEMNLKSCRKTGREIKRKGAKEGEERAGEKEKGNKARANTGVETAAQASPEGATEMGWKTNQGHGGDSAAALLPSSSSHGHLMCYIPATPVVTGISPTRLFICRITIHDTPRSSGALQLYPCIS